MDGGNGWILWDDCKDFGQIETTEGKEGKKYVAEPTEIILNYITTNKTITQHRSPLQYAN